MLPHAERGVLLPSSKVQLGRLQLANPITVASGTFGYAREMAGLVECRRLGAILPKTITSSLGRAIRRRGPSKPPAEC